MRVNFDHQLCPAVSRGVERASRDGSGLPDFLGWDLAGIQDDSMTQSVLPIYNILCRHD